MENFGIARIYYMLWTLKSSFSINWVVQCKCFLAAPHGSKELISIYNKMQCGILAIKQSQYDINVLTSDSVFWIAVQNYIHFKDGLTVREKNTISLYF